MLAVLVDEDKNVAEEMEKDWGKGQVMIGDADGNGQINSGDALAILKIAAKVLTPSEEQEKSADVRKNESSVNALFKYSSGFFR